MTPYHGQPILRNGLINGALNKRRNSDELPEHASQYIPTFSNLPPNASLSARYRHPPQEEPIWEPYWTRAKIEAWRHMRVAEAGVKKFRLRNLLSVRLALVLIWMYVLWWGEESTFDSKVEACAWDGWETWPRDAKPHHLVFIADPQLVDPHTYPGRPWPLSTLTMRYTDMYMRKSFQRIRDVLIPDSVLFLGDLFDGGREWSNDPDDNVDKKELVSSDKEWRGYGQSYWMKEYRRFGKIFFDTWLNARRPPRDGQRGRRLIASLPGNHDLGLGGGIRVPARQRFTAFFGDMNRIDVIGNHSFVSLDTVSFSAKGQVDIDAGTQGLREGDSTKPIWEPVHHFLHEITARKARAIDRELRVQHGRPEHEPMDSTVFELNDPRSHTIEQQPHADTDVPSIVLTHVPLYRAQGTPCGPLREKYPPVQKPTADGEYIEKEDTNSIQVAAGKQYQNVLTPAISNEIIELVGDVGYVFSGDDHDYCELVHREYTSKGGGVREITVKSTSWAMGVRHPGFLLVSLWNPIDAKGKAISSDLASKGTIQTHLCLLPDQLTTFIRYAMLLIATLLVLIIRAFRIVRRDNNNNSSSTTRKEAAQTSYLPTTRDKSNSANISLRDLPASTSVRPRSNTATHSCLTSPEQQHPQNNNRGSGGGLNARSVAVSSSSSSSSSRPRSLSPGGGYGLPAPAGGGEEATNLMMMRGDAYNYNYNYNNNWNNNVEQLNGGVGGAVVGRKSRERLHLFAVWWSEFSTGTRQVGFVVLVWYFYLLWTS